MTEANLLRLKLAVVRIQLRRAEAARLAALATALTGHPPVDLRTLATIPAIQLTDRKAKP